MGVGRSRPPWRARLALRHLAHQRRCTHDLHEVLPLKSFPSTRGYLSRTDHELGELTQAVLGRNALHQGSRLTARFAQLVMSIDQSNVGGTGCVFELQFPDATLAQLLQGLREFPSLDLTAKDVRATLKFPRKDGQGRSRTYWGISLAR